jgi:hypothetical protein
MVPFKERSGRRGYRGNSFGEAHAFLLSFHRVQSPRPPANASRAPFLLVLFLCVVLCVEQVFIYRARIFKLLRSPGIDSASLCSLAGRYANPIPTQFLAPIDCFCRVKLCAKIFRLTIPKSL